MYSDVVPDNASWLVSNGSYNARAVYPKYYNWLNSKIGQVITANGGQVVLSTGTITNYDFVVNTADETFRLPLLNGEERIPSTSHSTVATTVANGDRYTTGYNCYFVISCTLASGGRLKLTNVDTGEVQGSGSGGASPVGASVFARRGETVQVNCTGTIVDLSFANIKAVGNGTLYYYVGESRNTKYYIKY